MKYKNTDSGALFADHFRLEKLSNIGDPLEKLDAVIKWEMFRPILSKIYEKERKSNAGAKPYCPVLMFKILILQRYYNLGDGDTEFQIIDRLTFRRFLGLIDSIIIPDEKTIWNFRDQMAKMELEKELFDFFRNKLIEEGYILHEGKILDASFVEAPKQRNTKEENSHIKKEGKAPDTWEKNHNKLRQKDVDARWAKKNNETHFGYKNHAGVDDKSKLIDTYTVTSAKDHDSQATEYLVGEECDEGSLLYADSAYIGERCEKIISDAKMHNCVLEKGTKSRPLSDDQKENNKKKSKTRARVEHIFGFMEGSMNRLTVRCIGFVRASSVIGLTNLTYNLFRYEQILRLGKN